MGVYVSFFPAASSILDILDDVSFFRLDSEVNNAFFMPKPDGLFFATPLWQQPCRHQDASADVFFIGWFPQSCLKYEYVQQTSSNQHGFFRTVQGVASPFFRGILVVQVAKEEFGPDLASNAISLSLSLQTGTMCLKNIDS